MRVLIVGDAAVATGFARCTHAAADALYAGGHDVNILGINYRGDPHDFPYPIWPGARSGMPEDGFGVIRFPELLDKLEPEIVLLLQDAWNFPEYMHNVGPETTRPIPVVGWVAVDGGNQNGKALNGCASVITWTSYARKELVAGGYEGNAIVVPLGVDVDTFYPTNQKQARTRVVPEEAWDSFLVGAIGRNQPRKRLDLTISYFAEWVLNGGPEDAVLSLWTAPTGEDAWNLRQLVDFYGLLKRVIIATPPGIVGEPDDMLRSYYNSLDVQMTTTQGEGWGLCTMEGMACGCPQIVPDWSALGDWPAGAVETVPCTSIAHTVGNRIGVVGGIADRQMYVAALDRLYKDRDRRGELHLSGLHRVKQEQFRWDQIGERVAEHLQHCLARNC